MHFALRGTAALCALLFISEAFAEQRNELFNYQGGDLSFTAVSLIDADKNDRVVEVTLRYPNQNGLGMYSLRNPNRFVVNLPNVKSKPRLMRAPASGEVTSLRVTNFSGNTRIIFNLANLVPLPNVLVVEDQTILTLRFRYSVADFEKFKPVLAPLPPTPLASPEATVTPDVTPESTPLPVLTPLPEATARPTSEPTPLFVATPETAVGASLDLGAVAATANTTPGATVVEDIQAADEVPAPLQGEAGPAPEVTSGSTLTPSDPAARDGGSSEISNIPDPSASTPELDGEISETLFDLYIGDKYSGTVMARFTDKWCEIGEPGDAVDQFQEIKDKAPVQTLLAGKIFRKRFTLNVGSAECSTDTFRIVLNLQADNLKGKTLRQDGLIPDPETGLTFRQDVKTSISRADASGSGSENSSSALNHRTLFSYGKTYANLDATAIERSPYEINEAAIHTFYDIIRLDGGLLRTEGQAFARSASFTGVGMRSSEQILASEETLRGSSLEIFVPARARVQFFRASRLLDVQLLDFGLQQVDTSRFPQGSYDVDIVINGLDGSPAVTDRRFFTKSGLLSNINHPVFSLQGGTLRDETSTTDIPVGEGQFKSRLLSFLDFETTITGTPGVTIGSVDLIGLHENLILAGGYSQSNDNHYGITGSASGSIFGLTVAGNYSETFNSDPVPLVTKSTLTSDESTTADRVQRVIGSRFPFNQRIPVDEHIIDNISQKRRTTTGYIGKQFGKVELRYTYNQNEALEIGRQRTKGPVGIWRILDGNQNSIRAEISKLDTERGSRNTALLYFQHRFRPWLSELQLFNQTGSKNDQRRAMSSLSYDTKTQLGTGKRGRITADAVDSDNKSFVTSAEGQITSTYVRTGGFAVQRQGNENSATSVGANLDSSILVEREGYTSISFPAENESAVIVDVTSKTAKAPVEILVNNQVYGDVLPGRQQVIGLSPYRTYKVRIRPKEGGEIVGYDAEAFEFTLFPGNIVRKSWAIEKTFIGIGRLLNEAGEPIIHERIKGLRDYTVTEEDGTFQAEMNGFEAAIIKNKNRECTILFPKLNEVPVHFNDYGDVVCRSGIAASNESTAATPTPVSTPVSTPTAEVVPEVTPTPAPTFIPRIDSTPPPGTTVEVVTPE